ncbi:DUF5677 domain-containing protein [Streptomyces noursei]|uniref:DUF5677 domain-containing protein n=1 Tax=Streptomyces noursei TaxID=1971 RepID=UPI003450DAD6
MAYRFGRNEQCIKRVRAVTPVILNAARATVQHGVELCPEAVPVAGVLMGWWQFSNRTAAALVRLYDAGFTIEAAPLMRNLIGHSYAMNWLADNGQPAIRALQAHAENHRRKLTDNINATWHLPEPHPDVCATPLEFTDDEDERLHRRLLGELQNFDTLVKAYGSADVYPIYRYHSAYSHTTLSTADAYLHEDEGLLHYMTTPKGEISAERIWIPVALLQAAAAADSILVGRPMKSVIDKAMSDLGLPESILKPRRTRPPS